MKTYFERLLAHMEWANKRTLVSLRQRPVKDAIRLFSHVLTTERLYYERICERDPWPQDFWPALSLDQCALLLPQNVAQYRAFVDRCTEEAFNYLVRYRNSQGTVFHTPILDMFTHLALHGEHHRGQIARILREAGGEPAVTDYITYTREG